MYESINSPAIKNYFMECMYNKIRINASKEQFKFYKILYSTHLLCSSLSTHKCSDKFCVGILPIAKKTNC